MGAKSTGGAASSGAAGEVRDIQSGVLRHREARVPVDELELPDDAAGAGHRDVDDLGRPDRAHRPRTADGPAVDRDRAIQSTDEVAPRPDAYVVDRDRFRARVAQLVHEVRGRPLLEVTVDPYRSPVPRRRFRR